MANTSNPRAKIGAAVGMALTGAVWLVLGFYAGMLGSALSLFDGDFIIGTCLKYAVIGAVSGMMVGALVGLIMRSASAMVIGAATGAVSLAASGGILKILNLHGGQVGYVDVLEAAVIGAPIGGVLGALLGYTVGRFIRPPTREVRS